MFNTNDVVKFKSGKTMWLVNYLEGKLALISLESNMTRYNVDESKLVLVRDAQGYTPEENEEAARYESILLPEETPDQEPHEENEPLADWERELLDMAAQTEAAYAVIAEADREAYETDGRDGSYGRRILMALQTKPLVFAGLRDAVKPRLAKRRAKNRAAKQSRKANR